MRTARRSPRSQHLSLGRSVGINRIVKQYYENKLGVESRVALWCFCRLIAILVIGSSRQQIDLVSPDYYKDEIGYQNVIDARKNLAALWTDVAIHANEQ